MTAETTSISVPGSGPSGRVRVYPDQIMSKGTLMLIDHNVSGLSGVPAIGGYVHNIAHKAARLVLGAGDESALAAVATSAAMTGIVMEVTAKRGMHGIVSQTIQSASNQNYAFAVPPLIRDYIQANPTHKFLFGLWGYVTRKALIAGVPFADGTGTAAPTSNRFFMMYQGTTSKPTGNSARDAVNAAGGIQDIGPFIRNVSHDAFVGTLPAAANLRYEPIHFGPRTSDATGINKAPSWIHYRSYLEDLSVSGRTYEEVDAIDLALWTAAFGVGGRLYNDTFTAPSTNP